LQILASKLLSAGFKRLDVIDAFGIGSKATLRAFRIFRIDLAVDALAAVRIALEPLAREGCPLTVIASSRGAWPCCVLLSSTALRARFALAAYEPATSGARLWRRDRHWRLATMITRGARRFVRQPATAATRYRSAFLAGDARFGARPLMRLALYVRRLAAFTGYGALLVFFHAGEASRFVTHVPSLPFWETRSRLEPEPRSPRCVI
jgi:hypothetical protein